MIVFVTGSESTGKTVLAKSLAQHYQKNWIPEYARSYVENLERPYNFQDVEEIASRQIQDFKDARNKDLVFADTGLIITKIWFEKKFGKLPSWFSDVYEDIAQGYYLLCESDLPWISDPVRENPDIREELNYLYEIEINKLKYPFVRISGLEEARLLMAVKQVDKWLIENRDYEN